MLHERPMSYLYEVGIQGGIRRAADMLGINPSVISRQIAQLERALELPLLERQGRNVESVMSTFSQSWPNVFVDIIVGSMQEMLNDIASGEADMAVAFGPIGNPELKRHSFQWGPICAVVSPEHPIAALPAVTIDELTHYRLIALTDSFGLQRHMNAMFKTAGRQFHPAYRCNLFSTAMSLSQAGLGVSFMTAYAAREAIAHGILRAVPIDHPIASSAQCHLLRNSDRRFSPAAHHMWRLLHNAFRDAQRALAA